MNFKYLCRYRIRPDVIITWPLFNDDVLPSNNRCKNTAAYAQRMFLSCAHRSHHFAMMSIGIQRQCLQGNHQRTKRNNPPLILVWTLKIILHLRLTPNFFHQIFEVKKKPNKQNHRQSRRIGRRFPLDTSAPGWKKTPFISVVYWIRKMFTIHIHVFFLHIFHLVMPNRRWGKKKHTTSASSWEDNGLEKALLLLLQLKCENTSPIQQSPPPFLSTPERRDGSFAIFPGYEIKYGILPYSLCDLSGEQKNTKLLTWCT